MKRYTHTELHAALIERAGASVYGGPQAVFCPYYVPLAGVLGADWGVIVAPESAKFGELVFEHDWCGCEPGAHDEGNQRRDQWRDRKREREEAAP